MRIRWTSVPKVLASKGVGSGAGERLRDGSRDDSDREIQERSDRSRKAWARIVKREESSK